MCVTWKIAPMGQESETPRCNRIGGGDGRGVGRPCKTPKPKKVPQRGLGVALLEKIRLDEEQREKEDAAAMASSTKFPYDMHLQFLNFQHSNQPSSPNSLLSSTVSLANSGGSDSGRHGAPVLGHVSGPQLCGHHDFEFEKKNNVGMDPGLAFASSLPCESNSIRPLSNWVQRTQQKHPSSSIMSFSSGTSTTVLHSSTEPPSNQKYSGNYVTMRQEKMIGIKRPNPFSLDTSPVSSSNFKPLTFTAPMKASETISCESGRGFKLDFGNSTLREIPSLSASNSQPNSMKNKIGNKNLGDFLSLAPPTQCSCSKLKSPSAFLPFHRQGNMKNQVPRPSGYNQFNQQEQHWYNFIPQSAKMGQIGQQSDRLQNCNVVEQSTDLDLSLKL